VIDALSAPDERRAIFEADGERLVPTALARGPWYPNTQHGSAMLGLIARAVDRHPAPRPMQVVRLTVDFTRAAPLAPVTTPTRRIHDGRSVEIIEARIESGGETFARGTAMRFRIAEVDLSDAAPRYGLGTPPGLPAAGEGPQLPAWNDGGVEAFHVALEIRPTFATENPALWFRLRVPFVAGEETRPLVRCAVTADWTYSIPFLHALLSDPQLGQRDRPFTTINPDASLNLHRPMQGEWLCLDSHVHYSDCGAGSAVALLHDSVGPVGHSSQSILVRGPDKRPILSDELRQRR